MKKIKLLFATGLSALIIQGCMPRLDPLVEAQQAEAAGRYVEMLEICQEAVQEAYPSAQIFKCIGDAHLKLGNRSAAENAYLTYLEKMPTDTEVRYRLIEIYLSDGRSNIALPHVQKILALHPGEITALVFLGQIYTQLGRCEDARDIFKDALQQSPQNWEVKSSLDNLEVTCNGNFASSKPKEAPKPIVHKESTFQGGGKALNGDEW